MPIRCVIFSTLIVLFIDYSVANLSNVTNFRGVPEIRDGNKCVEGKRYKMGCNTCTCNRNSLICTKMACLNPTGVKKIMKQARRKAKKEYKRSRDATAKTLTVSDREYLMLPRLPHHASDCTPDKKYKVDCNVCICSKDKNLVCDNEMCVDQKSTRNIEAKKNSDKPCSKGFETKKCVKCKCKKGMTYCQPIPDCQTEEDKMMLSKAGGNFHRLTYDYKREECFSGVVYKDKCNNCYCQPDGTLRCTKKKCLNHAEALRLEEQVEYLEKHGL